MHPARALPLLLSCLLASLAAGQARAGAWLRAEGEGFASASTKIQHRGESKSYSTFYAEYGMNPDLTAGLDLGGDERGDYKALAFVLMPLRRDALHVGFQLAAGTIAGDPAVRPGISVGRSVQFRGLDGWTNLDIRAAILPGDVEMSVDATLGVNAWKGTQFIWQLQQGGALDRPDFMRATASVVWQIGPGRQMEVGTSTSLGNVEDFGMQIGLWQRF